MSLSSSLPFTIIMTHLAYSTLVKVKVLLGRFFWHWHREGFQWVLCVGVLGWLGARSWLVESYRFVPFWIDLFCSWGRLSANWVVPIDLRSSRGWSECEWGYDIFENGDGGDVLTVDSGDFFFVEESFELGFEIWGFVGHVGLWVLSKNNIRSHDLKNI